VSASCRAARFPFPLVGVPVLRDAAVRFVGADSAARIVVLPLPRDCFVLPELDFRVVAFVPVALSAVFRLVVLDAVVRLVDFFVVSALPLLAVAGLVPFFLAGALGLLDSAFLLPFFLLDVRAIGYLPVLR
jgi:hypothetical protein